jgi:predicted Ser/Thr protein kinase
MTDTKTCPRCGTPIRTDEGPGGLCAACLMKMGFDSRTGTASVVFTEAEKVDRPPAPSIADLAAHFPELEIRELVAQGGMGCVYRARQKSLERDVALKILTVGKDDPSFAGRFEREARTLAGLSHPNIVSIIEFGQRGPWTFLTMEFVEGASLRQMMRAHTVGPRESLSIVTQTCDALQYAHDKGVVHRDIKPENVLVTRDGRVKVLDFGLAKLVRGPQLTNLTQAHQVMGTPHYMAPEQWEKPATVDHRADIYALGVVFYELLTGELPLGRFQPPSHRVAVDVRLDDVVLKSLEKEPDRRYQHASEVKERVSGIAATPGGAPAAIVEKRSRSHVLAWSLAGVGCFFLLPALFVGMFLGYGGKRAANARTAAEQAAASPSPYNDSSVTQHVERDAPGASVSEGFVDLQMSPALAKRLGVQPAALDALNSGLEKVWQDYLRLEAEHVTCAWLPDGWLEVRVTAAADRRQALVDEADGLLSKALGKDKDLTQSENDLRAKTDKMLRFGAKPEHVAIQIEKDRSLMRALDADDTGAGIVSRADTGHATSVTTVISARGTHSSASAAYERLWQRMLPSRPPQSK